MHLIADTVKKSLVLDTMTTQNYLLSNWNLQHPPSGILYRDMALSKSI